MELHQHSFLVIKTSKNIESMCQKWCHEKIVDSLLIKEECKRYYIFIKDFKTFMYDYTLHRGTKQFCRYCLQALEQQKYWTVTLIIVLKLMVNK